MENGRTTDLADVDINEEIDRTLRAVASEIPPGTEIERDLDPVPPLRCPPGTVGIVILNILRNAFQARSEGLRLRIRTRADDGGVALEIADNGPGIPPEILPRIFEPFFTTRNGGGSKGLGLSVVSDIARALGGRIEVESTAGGGAAFRLRLPLRENPVPVR